MVAAKTRVAPKSVVKEEPRQIESEAEQVEDEFDEESIGDDFQASQ